MKCNFLNSWRLTKSLISLERRNNHQSLVNSCRKGLSTKLMFESTFKNIRETMLKAACKQNKRVDITKGIDYTLSVVQIIKQVLLHLVFR